MNDFWGLLRTAMTSESEVEATAAFVAARRAARAAGREAAGHPADPDALPRIVHDEMTVAELSGWLQDQGLVLTATWDGAWTVMLVTVGGVDVGSGTGAGWLDALRHAVAKYHGLI